MQVFQKELGKRTGTVQVLKRSGRELIENSRDDTTWVKVQLQELSNRWDTVCKLSVSKQTRLEQALKQVRRKPWVETLLGSFAGLWVCSARSSGKRFYPGRAGPTNPAAVPVKQWGGISQLLILFPKKKKPDKDWFEKGGWEDLIDVHSSDQTGQAGVCQCPERLDWS